MSLTAQELAGIVANGTAAAAGDRIETLLAKLVALLGSDHYLGSESYTFPGNDSGSLAELLETELALYPTVRTVAIYNDGDNSQTVDGDTLAAGAVVALTLAEVVAATYAVTGTGGESFKVFFIA